MWQESKTASALVLVALSFAFTSHTATAQSLSYTKGQNVSPAYEGWEEKAYASLRLDYKVDDVVKASETGALGAGTSSPEVRANVPPVAKVQGPKTLTAKVGQPLTLTMLVTDDGIPKPRGAGLAGAAVAL